MDKKKLFALSESIMLGTDEVEEIGGGAEGIVSYIKRIEDFTKGTDAAEWVADGKGKLLTSVDPKVTAGNTDESKAMISNSSREKDGFVVIPRVV
jgi:Asp-tRNA(Asn)/Glu-tRNA(Gln) amidotransferase C subunit